MKPIIQDTGANPAHSVRNRLRPSVVLYTQVVHINEIERAGHRLQHDHGRLTERRRLLPRWWHDPNSALRIGHSGGSVAGVALVLLAVAVVGAVLLVLG